MRILLKRQAVLDSGESERVMADLKKAQDAVEESWHQYNVAQRIVNSRISAITELAGRLKHRNYPTRERDRLESDYARMTGDLPRLEGDLADKQQAYDRARELLKQQSDQFQQLYLQIDVADVK